MDWNEAAEHAQSFRRVCNIEAFPWTLQSPTPCIFSIDSHPSIILWTWVGRQLVFSFNLYIYSIGHQAPDDTKSCPNWFPNISPHGSGDNIIASRKVTSIAPILKVNGAKQVKERFLSLFALSVFTSLLVWRLSRRVSRNCSKTDSPTMVYKLRFDTRARSGMPRTETSMHTGSPSGETKDPDDPWMIGMPAPKSMIIHYPTLWSARPSL